MSCCFHSATTGPRLSSFRPFCSTTVRCHARSSRAVLPPPLTCPLRMAWCLPLALPSHLWLRSALHLTWQERVTQTSHLCGALVSPVWVCSESDHLHLTASVFHALCSFNLSALRMLSCAPSVSVDEAVGALILHDGDEPLRTLFTSLAQLPGCAPPLLSVRSLYAGGEFVQCALDTHLPLPQLSSLSLHPLTHRSQSMHVRNQLWCALYCLRQLRRLKLHRYNLCGVDHSVLFSLPLEHLDLSNCTRAESAVGSMAAVGVSSTIRSLLLETEGTRIGRREASALLLNLSRVPRLRYFALSSVLTPHRLRLLSFFEQLTGVDLSSSAIDPAYLSYFTTSTGVPALPCLMHFSSAQADFVQRERFDYEVNSLQRHMLCFARTYSKLHTYKLVLGREATNDMVIVAKALSEVKQVRAFGLRVAQRDDTIEHDELHDSDEEEQQAEGEEKEEDESAAAATAITAPSPCHIPHTLTLNWLAMLELDAVPLQDASLLTVLKGCKRLRRVTCRDCGQQTTAAWLLAAINAPHLISLILYAEEVKATAAAWKTATEAYPSLAYLIEAPSPSQSAGATTNSSGYPGLAQVEIRVRTTQQSDRAGFTSLMQLLSAAPLTALNIHLPTNALLGSRTQQLQAMSHIQSLHIVPLPASMQADTVEAQKHSQTADKIQDLLTRCVCSRQRSQQQYAQCLAASWDREVMRDGQEGKEGDSMASQEAAVDALLQDDDYTQASGMFSRSFTTSSVEGQVAGREQFFHELAGLHDAEEDK